MNKIKNIYLVNKNIYKIFIILKIYFIFKLKLKYIKIFVFIINIVKSVVYVCCEILTG